MRIAQAQALLHLPKGHHIHRALGYGADYALVQNLAPGLAPVMGCLILNRVKSVGFEIDHISGFLRLDLLLQGCIWDYASIIIH